MLIGLVFLTGRTVAGDSLKTNLDLMRKLAVSIGAEVEEVIGTRHAARIGLDLKPRETAWYIESSLAGGIISTGRKVETLDSADVIVEYGVSGLQVEYSHVRRNGLFGSEIVDRTIRVAISARASERVSGKLIGIKDFAEFFVDTIETEEVALVENPNIAITHSPLPGGGLFSSIVEPLIILGSVAIGVFLLFHVRS